MLKLKRIFKKKRKIEFSKLLLVQESILIWIVTLFCLFLAFYCITNQYYSELGWIATMIACPWTAYGVSQAFYYKKAEKENTKDGIKFESAMAEIQQDFFQKQDKSSDEAAG